METEKTKCLIVGSGPAGYTAAIYVSRAGFTPILYEGMAPGGQLTTTTRIENFPGFPDGIDGGVLMENMKQQAIRYGADIRMGAVTGVDFTMQDIDRLSRRVPVLCKVAPNSHYHIQDVNRAGGIFAILGELDRAGLLDTSVLRVDGRTLGEAIPACDILNPAAADAARRRALSAPAGHYSRELGAQHSYYEEPDTDRTAGCIRDVEHAYFRDGGLAVLTGNIARQGCVVKTAGVDEKLFVFRGPARVYESQEQAMNGILADEVQPGEVVVIRYEGPKGGPGMQEMLYPTSYLKSKHLDKACALITDGRFSGGTSGLSIGHVSPEAASGGEIAVVRTGDEIEIDIPGRSIRLAVDDAEIAVRMAAQERFRPAGRDRCVPASLRAYARLVSSADKGAVRIVDDNEE